MLIPSLQVIFISIQYQDLELLNPILDTYEVPQTEKDLVKRFIQKCKEVGYILSKDMLTSLLDLYFTDEHNPIPNIKEYIDQYIRYYKNYDVANRLLILSRSVIEQGINEEAMTELEDLTKSDTAQTDIETLTSDTFLNVYEGTNIDKSHISTCVRQLDAQVGGIQKGKLTSILGFTGCFKCVHEDTRIMTNVGMIPIKEVFYRFNNGEDLYAESEKGLQKITAVHNEGVKHIYSFKLDGVELKTSKTHKFKVWRDCKLQWVEVGDLQEGDYVAFVNNEHCFGKEKRDLNYLYTYGLLTGDGGLRDDKGINLWGTKEDVETYKPYIDKCFDNGTYFDYEGKSCINTVYRVNKNKARFDFTELYGKLSTDKFVPDFIFKLDKECISAYLSGLFDTDGSIATDSGNVYLSTSSYKLVQQVAELLSLYGIKSTIATLGYYDKPAYRLILYHREDNIKFKNEIGFKLKRKNDRINDKVPSQDTRLPKMSLLADEIDSNDKIIKRLKVKNKERGNCYIERRILKYMLDCGLQNKDAIEIVENNYKFVKVTEAPKFLEYGHLYDLTINNNPTYLINGFVSHNTTLALNIAYAAQLREMNTLYLSLEVSKFDVYANLLSRHSNQKKFTTQIPHLDLKQHKLSEQDYEYLKNTIVPDYNSLTGKVYIIDDTDIGSYSQYSLEQAFTQINDKAIQETGHGIDICVVDHINLLKFGESKLGTTDAVNKYTTFFRQQAVNWCKTKQPVAMIVLAQSNREGGEYARKHDGNYLLGHFAEGNELERASSLVLTTYSDDALKTLYTAKVGLIKNRDGAPIEYAFETIIEPEYYTFGNTLVNDNLNTDFTPPSLEDVCEYEPVEYSV